MTKSAKQEKYDVPKLAFSIPEFCVAHGISESHFYQMRDRGHGPREMRFGNRVMISIEAAADWRRQMEIENSEETPREGHSARDDQSTRALPPTPAKAATTAAW